MFATCLLAGLQRPSVGLPAAGGSGSGLGPGSAVLGSSRRDCEPSAFLAVLMGRN